MHNSRLFALVGVGIGIMGLFLPSLNTAGEGLLPTLSQSAGGFPDGIPTIWGGIATWAQVVLVILIATVVFISFRPPHEKAPDRTSAGIVAVIGLAVMAYAVVRWADAVDKADALEGAFLQAAQADIIPAAYTVAPSVGFVVLLVGTVLVLFAGVVGLRSESSIV